MSLERPTIRAFFDAATGTVSYVVSDPSTRRAAVIDPVLDYDVRSGRTATFSADALLAHLNDSGLTVEWILETHAHADHLSAASHLQERVQDPPEVAQEGVGAAPAHVGIDEIADQPTTGADVRDALSDQPDGARVSGRIPVRSRRFTRGGHRAEG